VPLTLTGVGNVECTANAKTAFTGPDFEMGI
jgi:hypothetical protein